MQEYNKFDIYDPGEFILSKTFGEYALESQKLISDLLIKVHYEKFEFSIKVRKNKEFAITLNDDFAKNILTVWIWADYIQILVSGEIDEKVNCYNDDDISKELIARIYKKYCERYTSQMKLDI